MKKIILLLLLGLSAGVFASKIDELKQECDNGNGQSCFNLGLMYDNDKGVKQDYFKAVTLYQKACGLDIGSGCFNLEVSYYNGKGVRQSNQKALEYWGKACDLKLQSGCKNYAMLKKIINKN